MKTTTALLLLLTHFSAHGESIYRATTTIGNRTFQDILIIESFNPLKGTLTVPGVFSAPIQDMNGLGDSLNFGIVAKERGEEFKVYYKLKTLPGYALKGTANLEDGGLLGTVHAQRIFVE